MKSVNGIFDRFLRFAKTPYYHWASRRTSFLEYRKLVMLRFLPSLFLLPENSLYGHRDVLRACGIRAFGARIEHGVCMSRTGEDLSHVFSKWKRRLFFLKRIYTFGDTRKAIIEEWAQRNGVPVAVKAIGPYVKHVRHFLDATALRGLKAKLGRVLLVYPQHNIRDVNYKYDSAAFMSKIREMAKMYDTVLVSIYWLDAINGLASEYEAAGYTVVTAGFATDPYFMRRQKDIIALSDMILTNSIGTHVGYAISMQRPCRIFCQEFEKESENGYERKMMNESEWAFPEFYAAFSREDGVITDEQRELVSKWWGDSKEDVI